MTPPDVIETSVGPVAVLHRLVLGLVVRDAVTSYGVAPGVRAGWEPDPLRLPRGHRPWWPCVDLEPVGAGRFRLRETPPRPATVVLRLHDPARRWVARRIELTLPSTAVPVPSRTVPLWLSPGAAYPLPRGATAVRGRVARDGVPVPWARLVAVGPGNAVLGRAHADDRGEFLLRLAETNQNPVQSSVPVELRVRGPVAVPVPRPPDGDPLADLVAEPVPTPSVPPVASDVDGPLLRGEVPLPGFVANQAAALTPTVPVGAELVLSDDVPFDPGP